MNNWKMIEDSEKFSGQTLYVPHNLSKENLSVILPRHTLAISDISKKKFHLIVEEDEGEALSHDEINNIRNILKAGNLISLNIAILA